MATRKSAARKSAAKVSRKTARSRSLAHVADSASPHTPLRINALVHRAGTGDPEAVREALEIFVRCAEHARREGASLDAISPRIVGHAVATIRRVLAGSHPFMSFTIPPNRGAPPDPKLGVRYHELARAIEMARRSSNVSVEKARELVAEKMEYRVSDKTLQRAWKEQASAAKRELDEEEVESLLAARYPNVNV